MKKILLLSIAFMVGVLVNAQGLENFDGVTSSGSYSDASFTGQDGSTWSYTNSRTDQGVNGNAVTMNDDNSNTFIESGLLNGGIGSLTITTQRKFGGGSGDINILVNGNNVGTIPYSGTEQTTTISNIDISGAFTLRINNDIGGSSNGGADRVAVDDVTWTAFAGTGANQAPSITNVVQNPTISITSSDLVSVTSTIIDPDGDMLTASLDYGFVSGSYTQSIAATTIVGDEFTFEIPTQVDGTEVFYQVNASDNGMPVESDQTMEFSYVVADPIETSFIAIQDFDNSGPIWNYTSDVSFFDNTYGSDGFYGLIDAGSAAPLSNVNFQNLVLAENDLDDEGNGTTGFANITFDPIDVTGFNDVEVSFDYEIIGYNANDDDAKYELFIDGISQGETFLVDGGVDPDNASGNIMLSIPNGSTSVSLIVSIRNNGSTGFSGFDNFTVSGSTVYIYDNTNMASPWSPADPTAGGVSTIYDDIIIVNGTTSFSADIDARNVTIQSGTLLDLGANSLNLTGVLNNLGTLVSNDATINLSGIDAQNIDVTDITVENLVLNNANGAALNGSVNVEGLLTLSNGVLTTNDNLTLKSSAGKSAAVAPVLSGLVVGDVTVEQFYSNKRAYRFVGSTVTTSSSILANWQQSGLNPGDMGYEPGFGTHITGGTPANGFDQSGSNATSIFTYNNASQVWEGVTNTNATSLSSGNAYRLFIRGDRSVSLTTANAPSTSTVLRTKGTLSNSFVDINNLSTTDGAFNFIANPYQALVNFATLMADADTEDINESVYYAWDPTIGDNGAYVTYDFGLSMNNVGGSEVDQFLQPGQAVFVVTSEDGNNAGLTPGMRFKQSFKVSSTDTNNVYRSSNNGEMIVISLYKDTELNTGLARDGVILKFDSNGHNQVNSRDVIKFLNPDENLSVQTSGFSLSITERAAPLHTEMIDLKLEGLTGVNYTFNINNSLTMLQTILVDDYLGTETTLANGVNSISVSFDSNAPASLDPNRFSLKFENSVLTVDDSAFAKAIKAYPNPLSGSELIINNLLSGEAVEIDFYNTLGQKVFSHQNSSSTGSESLNDLHTLASGIYLIQVRQGNLSTAIKVILE